MDALSIYFHKVDRITGGEKSTRLRRNWAPLFSNFCNIELYFMKWTIANSIVYRQNKNDNNKSKFIHCCLCTSHSFALFDAWKNGARAYARLTQRDPSQNVTMQNCFQLIEFHFVLSIRVENIAMENSAICLTIAIHLYISIFILKSNKMTKMPATCRATLDRNFDRSVCLSLFHPTKWEKEPNRTKTKQISV